MPLSFDPRTVESVAFWNGSAGRLLSFHRGGRASASARYSPSSFSKTHIPGHDIFGAWSSFQWLPSNVSFSENRSPRITSYINNLHPQMHRDLYNVLEQLVGFSIPLWNECLSRFQQRLRIQPVAGSIDDFTLPPGMKYHPPRDDPSASDNQEDGLSLEQMKERNLVWDDDFQNWFYQHCVLIQPEPNAFISRKQWESQPITSLWICERIFVLPVCKSSSNCQISILHRKTPNTDMTAGVSQEP